MQYTDEFHVHSNIKKHHVINHKDNDNDDEPSFVANITPRLQNINALPPYVPQVGSSVEKIIEDTVIFRTNMIELHRLKNIYEEKKTVHCELPFESCCNAMNRIN